MSLPSQESVTTAFNAWNLDEHRRLHMSGTSVQSEFSDARRSAALPLADINNKPFHKTMQHLQRLRQRAFGMEEAGFEVEYVDRAVSDSLKLMAGQQVKRTLGRAASQADFIYSLIIAEDLTTPGLVDKVYISFGSNPIGKSYEEFNELHVTLNGALETINTRAIEGSDWGQENSEMVTAAIDGEEACARFGIAIVSFAAEAMGGFEAVSLRVPAEDAADVARIYPFRGPEIDG